MNQELTTPVEKNMSVGWDQAKNKMKEKKDRKTERMNERKKDTQLYG